MIYVCIPSHNEATTIGVLLWKTRKVLGEFGRDYRLVVHDDASDDDTADVLQRYRRAVPLTILRSEERIGYGPSVELLLRHVRDQATYPKRDCAVILQGDFTESPEDIVPLIKMFEGGADIVSGAVTTDGAPHAKGMKLVRWAASKLLRRILAGAPVSDPFVGLRAYRVIVLKKAFRDRAVDNPLIGSDGWAANVEILGRLAPHARRIVEVPLTLRYDLQARPSRFRPWKTFHGLSKLSGSLWVPEGPEPA